MRDSEGGEFGGLGYKLGRLHYAVRLVHGDLRSGSCTALASFAYTALAASEDLHASVGTGGPAPLPASSGMEAAAWELGNPHPATAVRTEPRSRPR